MKKKWNKKKITRKIMISKLSFRNVNEMLLIHAMKFERCNQTRKCKHLLVFIHNLRNQNCFVMWNCSCIENATKIIIFSSIQLFLFIFNLEVLFGSMVCKCRTLYCLIRAEYIYNYISILSKVSFIFKEENGKKCQFSIDLFIHLIFNEWKKIYKKLKCRNPLTIDIIHYNSSDIELWSC